GRCSTGLSYTLIFLAVHNIRNFIIEVNKKFDFFKWLKGDCRQPPNPCYLPDDNSGMSIMQNCRTSP
ncbi:MAG: hypothetical protein ONB11_07395, partial [candidate division KSB1 bacterium]|nr:hypothetical protein [candidate division KSB1 bacterium]